MIIQLEVLKRIVKRINTLVLISLLAVPAIILVCDFFVKDPSLKGMLYVFIPMIFICIIAVYFLRYLYLSYSTIEKISFQKPKYSINFFVLSLILPFLNIIIAPFYFIEMVKYYEYPKKDKVVYIISLIVYEITCIINTVRIIDKNIDSKILSDNGIIIFSAIEVIVIIANALVFINTMIKNQNTKLKQFDITTSEQ